ncbi:MAG: HXXEE domain-containing protein [Spirochaetia bacterium]|jgi:hypothetical protein|nr:HXXEE domain-containing protein [Spirochaetia bacterium]
MDIKEYYSWLKRDWAKTGLIVSIFLFAFLVVFVKKSDFVIFLILLQTPLYMIHETEEYIFPGGFGKFFNVNIFKLDTEDKPIDQNFIFYVNIVLIWILLPAFGLLATINYQYGLWIPYFSLFAGVAHIALGIKAGKLYNPGLIVSLGLNIPVSIWSISYLTNNQIIHNAILNPHLAIGLGVNLVLPIVGTIMYKKHIKNNPV